MNEKLRTSDCILKLIGNTPLLELTKVVPENSGRVFVKVEAANPSGSMKDRMAMAMIESAERDGRLSSGGNVVEYTGGSTGVSLALVCRAKGYPLHIVTNDVVSIDKRNHMKALGAELTVIHSPSGKLEASLTKAMINRADLIRQEKNAFWTDQFNNRDQSAGYQDMANEIWIQTDGLVDAFVHCVGTAGSLMGASKVLRERKSTIHIVAIEPEESAVLSGRPSGGHQIEGVGAGFVVPLWNPDSVNDIAIISTEEAMETSRRLAREEALFAGTSTGANVAAAIKLAQQLGTGTVTVTLACDSGMKYLGTRLYGQGQVDH